MGSRRKARVLAFQALFSWDSNREGAGELNSFLWLDDEMRSRYDDDVLVFARLILNGTIENIEAVDKIIEDNLEHWDLNRVGKVDLAILRMSVYALKFQKDIPHTVTIDEAIDIAKIYGSDESYRFINGVLDGIIKSWHENK